MQRRRAMEKIKLPACREERQIELLEEFAANPGNYDVYKVVAELRYLVSEQLAEERRKEMAAR
jgi:hypothetical protein